MLFAMKKKSIFSFIALLLSLLVSGNAQAQRGRGEIAVRSEDGEKLGISVDGRRYDRFSAEFLLGNIPTGRRSVTIYRLRPHRNDDGATAQTVYEGQLLVRAGYRILMRVNAANGGVSIQHQELLSSPVPQRPDAPSAPPARTPPLALPQANNWQTQVESKTTDTERLRILKARVTSGAVATTELLEMMATLSFEDSRLELAQAAAPRISDRENINKVSAAFENPDSRKTFEEAAGQKR